MYTIAQPGTFSDKELEAWSFTPDQIPAAWPELEPFVLRALEHARGELSVEDVRQFLLKGLFAAFATAKGGVIQLVIITELCYWPQYTSVRIVALAGTGLADARQFVGSFISWCLSRGAVELEALCRPAMTRMLQPLGFNKAYDVVRLDLRSRLQ